jgi:hypothetical protein
MKHNEIKQKNFTLMAMQILRLPAMQKINPFSLVSAKQLDALAEALENNLVSSPMEVIQILKENA